ncbi:MAG: Ig-like domain-containing protein [Clostridia bacterium]|nr:Ig-like domain-containing protein [Clostridia bacterium]
MKKLSKIFIPLISLLIVLVAFSACAPAPDPSQPQKSLTLDQTAVLLEVNDAFTLTATKKNIDEEVIWLCSDENKATVNEGRIFARSEGLVTVSVMAGEYMATCQVVIVKDGDLPRLNLETYDTLVEFGDSFDLSPTLVYEGRRIDANFEFSSSDKEVIDVSKKGKVTATGVGKTNVSVTASLYGYTTTTFVEITVKPRVVLASSLTEILLGTSEVNDYAVSAKVDLGVVLNGDFVQNPALTWSSQDESVATVNEGLVTAKGVGKTTIDVLFISYGYEFSYSLPVTVEKPVVESQFDFAPVDYNADDSDSISLNFDEGISPYKSADVVKIVDEKTGDEIAFTVDGDSLAINKTDLTVGEKSYLLEWDSVAYKVNFTLASKVIKTAQEFANMYDYLTLASGVEGEGGSVFDGYLVLGADVDATDLNMSFGNWGSNGWFNVFGGTLDGRNHIIYNLDETNSNGGIFASTSNDAVIKNLRFYNAKISGSGGYLVTGFAGKAENIFVSGSITGGGAEWAVTSMLFCKLNGTAKLKNITVVLEDNSLDESKFAGIVFGEGYENLKLENVVTLQIAGTPTPNYNIGRVMLSSAQNHEDKTVKAFASAKEYFDWLDGDSDKSWASFATEEIANYIKASVAVTADEYEIIAGESKTVTVNTAWLKETMLKEKVDGVTYSFDFESGQGVITVEEKVPLKTTFTVKSVTTTGEIAEVTFTVARKLKYTLAPIGDVEINGGESVFTIDLCGYAINGVTDVLFNDVSLPVGSWREQNGKIIIQKDKIKALYGEGVITIVSQPLGNEDEKNRTLITTNVTLVTKFINSLDDLNNMKKYSAYTQAHTWTLWGSNFTEDEWHGHFVLAKNLELGTGEVTSKKENNISRIWDEGDAGFYGTFDGRGHYIKGGVYANGGILGHGNKQAVVKDVAFVDVALGENSWSGVIATSFWGKIENVLVTIVTDNRKNGEGGALIVNGAGNFTANNIIVYDKGGRTKENAGQLSSYVNHQSYGKGANVYIFTNYYVSQEKYESNCHIEPITLGTTLTGAGVDKSAFDANIWDLNGDEAKFVSMN